MARKAEVVQTPVGGAITLVELSQLNGDDTLTANAAQGQTFLFNLFNKHGRNRLTLRFAGNRSIVVTRNEQAQLSLEIQGIL